MSDAPLMLQSILDESIPLAVAADWLMEHDSATIESFLNQFRYRFQKRAEVLVWADAASHTEAYWSERRERWIFTDFSGSPVCQPVNEWVEVTAGYDVEPDNGLNQEGIAFDMEGPHGIWVVPPEALSDLLETYGNAIAIRRVGTDKGEILTGSQATYWCYEQKD